MAAGLDLEDGDEIAFYDMGYYAGYVDLHSMLFERGSLIERSPSYDRDANDEWMRPCLPFVRLPVRAPSVPRPPSVPFPLPSGVRVSVWIEGRLQAARISA